MAKTFPADLIELSKSISATTDIMEQALPEIDEAHFVNLFLPILTSEDSNVDLSPWLAVCGRGSVPVRVFKMEGDKKVYLYKVPALLDASGLTRTVYTARRSMSHAITDAIVSAQSRPAGMRDKILYDKISQADVGQSKENEESIAEWNYILRLYGKKPLSDTLPERVNAADLKPLDSTAVAAAVGNTSVVVEGFEDEAW